MPYVSTPFEDFGFIRVVPESMDIRLEPVDGTPEVFATVMLSRTDSEVCNAVVDWDNAPMMTTLVRVTEVGADPWWQRFKLVLAALSLKSKPPLLALEARHWRKISLSMRDQMPKSPKGQVDFSVDARDWVAQLGWSGAPGRIELPVPERLHHEAVGTVLIQMCMLLLPHLRPS